MNFSADPVNSIAWPSAGGVTSAIASWSSEKAFLSPTLTLTFSRLAVSYIRNEASGSVVPSAGSETLPSVSGLISIVASSSVTL